MATFEWNAFISTAAEKFTGDLLAKSKEHENLARLAAIRYAETDNQSCKADWKKNNELSELYRKLHSEAVRVMTIVERDVKKSCACVTPPEGNEPGHSGDGKPVVTDLQEKTAGLFKTFGQLSHDDLVVNAVGMRLFDEKRAAALRSVDSLLSLRKQELGCLSPEMEAVHEQVRQALF